MLSIFSKRDLFLIKRLVGLTTKLVAAEEVRWIALLDIGRCYLFPIPCQTLTLISLVLGTGPKPITPLPNNKIPGGIGT